MSPLDTVYVRAVSDPHRFAGFSSLDALNDWLALQGRGGGEYGEVDDSIGEPTVVYVADPDAETLIGSAEFQKLNEAMKEAVFRDPQLTQAFAEFIRDNGQFVVGSSSLVIFDPANNTITLPQQFLTPGPHHLGAAFFVVAHEIYHHKYQWVAAGTPVTRETWGLNEAKATWEAYLATIRAGVTVGDGLDFSAGSAFQIAKSAPDEQSAMVELQEHYAREFDSKHSNGGNP